MAEKKHFLRAQDLSASEIETLFWLARQLKRDRAEGRRRHELSGRHIALYMEKPSVRTRISFTVGVRELGGDVVELVGGQTKLGSGEHPFDFAAVVSRYCHAIVARVHSDEALEQMVKGATVPVINALSDGHHPCQALADFFTLRERFNNLKGLKIAYVGDGKNNVARSLIDMGKLLGVEIRVAAPEGFQPLPEVAEGITVTTDPKQAVAGVHAIYTDTWVSMGNEAEAEARRAAFAGFKVDEDLLALALPEAVVMHCLPAVRDEEISASLLHDPRSAILDQAENRLHTQKALLLLLVENRHERPRHENRDGHRGRDGNRGDGNRGDGNRGDGRGDGNRGENRGDGNRGDGRGEGNRGRGPGNQEGRGRGPGNQEGRGRGPGNQEGGGSGSQEGGGRPPRQREERPRSAETPAEGQPQGEGAEGQPQAGDAQGERRGRRRRGRGRDRERNPNQPQGEQAPREGGEAPRAEGEGAPRAEGGEAPRNEGGESAPRHEAPAAEAPRHEAPAAETPRVDAPKTEGGEGLEARPASERQPGWKPGA